MPLADWDHRKWGSASFNHLPGQIYDMGMGLTSSMKIKRLPNILALHLKRFKYQESLGRYTKLFYRVPFPLELRLPNTSDDAENPDRLYELFAMIVHIGK